MVIEIPSPEFDAIRAKYEERRPPPAWVMFDENHKHFYYTYETSLAKQAELAIYCEGWISYLSGVKDTLEAQERIVDLANVHWQSLCESAKKSNWIPEEYWANDWLADLKEFLERGHDKKLSLPPFHKDAIDEVSCDAFECSGAALDMFGKAKYNQALKDVRALLSAHGYSFEE